MLIVSWLVCKRRGHQWVDTPEWYYPTRQVCRRCWTVDDRP